MKETHQLAGNNKNISNEPIIVKIRGENLQSMSFLDLPGLTKIPTHGQ